MTASLIHRRSPQRKYTQDALSFWFDALQIPWEKRFSNDDLMRGRQLYREGVIRSIDLGKDYAVVSPWKENADVYAIVEIRQGILHLRLSSQRDIFGEALGIAGIYEIEELLADEFLDMPEALGTTTKRPEEFDPPTKQTLPTETQPIPSSPASTASLSPDPPPPPPVFPRLDSSARGIRLRAYFRDATGNLRDAFKHAWDMPTEAAAREAFVRLMGLAHTCGFRKPEPAQGFFLREPEQIDRFIQDKLPVWKNIFPEILCDERLSLLARGVREVGGQLKGERKDKNFRFQWAFEIDRRPVPAPLVRRLLHAGDAVCFDPDWGMLRLAPSTRSAINNNSEKLKQSEGEIPLHMAFSLYSQTHRLFAPETAQGSHLASLAEGPDPQTSKDWGGPACANLLRDYQKRGGAFMEHWSRFDCHGLLADEMGLGKTRQVLALLAINRTQSTASMDAVTQGELPSLVVCPASVVPVWEEEAQRCFPQMRTAPLLQGVLFRERPEVDLWISSYSQLRRHRAQLEETQFRYAVLDEAQMIKNPESKAAQACLRIRARHRLALSGTPLENRPLDVWSIFRFLMPGLLGKRTQFEDFYRKNPAGAVQRLHAQLAPFVLRRTKEDVLPELPPRLVISLQCPLLPAQRLAYAQLTGKVTESLGDSPAAALQARPTSLFALFTRLRQVCCDPGLLPGNHSPVTRSGKIQMLLEKLSEALATQRKVVIFSQFVTLLDRLHGALRERFPELPLFRLTGSTRNRAETVAGFQTGPNPAVILISLKAGGTGITLHAADCAFLLDPWWNPAVEEQAFDRLHRLGQKNAVTIYRMITKGTIEEKVESLKQHKSHLFAETFSKLGEPTGWIQQFPKWRDLLELTM